MIGEGKQSGEREEKPPVSEEEKQSGEREEKPPLSGEEKQLGEKEEKQGTGSTSIQDMGSKFFSKMRTTAPHKFNPDEDASGPPMTPPSRFTSNMEVSLEELMKDTDESDYRFSYLPLEGIFVYILLFILSTLWVVF